VILVLTVAATGLFVSVAPAYAQVELKPKSLCGTTIKTSVTLTSNLLCTKSDKFGDAIRIGVNGITLNCAGYAIENTGSVDFGIDLNMRNHVTVENCHVEYFYFFGIDVSGSHNILKRNILYEDGSCDVCSFEPAGMILYSTSSNTVIDNTATGNYHEGFAVEGSSSSNIIANNVATSNVMYGFYDLTSGSGTAGTANTYTTNTCIGNNGGGTQSSPAGLC